MSPLLRFVLVALVLAGAREARALEQITGTIRAAAGNVPLVGIDIDVFDAQGTSVSTGNAISDANGVYVAVVPGPATYTIRADPTSVQGVAAQYFDHVHLASQAQPIAIGAGQTVSGIDFSLQAGVAISGVITASGVPVAAIDLDVYASNGEALGAYNGTSDAIGAYSIGALPPGTYFVRADPTVAQLLVREFFGGTRTIAGATPIALGATPVGGVSIDLDPGGTISGVVRAASNAAPIAGVDLDLYDANGARIDVNAATDAVGGYEIGALPTGSYRLVADPAASLGVAYRFYASAIGLAGATPIAVTAGQRTLGIDFSLGSAGAIAGTVRNPQSQPAAGVDLDLFDRASGERLTRGTTTLADGSYRLDALNPGTFALRVDPTLAQGWARQYYSGQPILASAQTLSIAAGVTTTPIDFDLAPGGAIAGRVTPSGSATGTAGVAIHVVQAGSLVEMDQVDTTGVDGIYTIPALPVGSYLVRAEPAIGQPYGITFFGNSPNAAGASPVAVLGGTTANGTDIALPEPGAMAAGLAMLAVLAGAARGRSAH